MHIILASGINHCLEFNKHCLNHFSTINLEIELNLMNLPNNQIGNVF